MANETQALAVVARSETGIATRSALLEPNNLSELQQLGTLMANSGFFADSKQAAQACVKILAGRELGMPPIASMVGISIIQGKPVMGANLIAAAMKRAGYSWTVPQRDLKGCKLVISFRGHQVGTTEFLEEDALRAQLLSKDNWKKFPRSMYFARAITDAARTYAPEVFSGMPAYTAEEMGAEYTDEDGAVIQQNTAAQQEALAQRRIEELQPPPPPSAPVSATPAPPPPAEIQLTPVEQADRRFIHTTGFDRLKLFVDLKARLVKALGEEQGHDVYYDVLGRFDVGHENEFKKLGPMRECHKVMVEAAIKAEEAARNKPNERGISDNDLPAALFSQETGYAND